MSSPPTRSTATTPRYRCWRRGWGELQPGGCGSMCATIGCLAAQPLRRRPISTVLIVGPSTRRRTWSASPAFCKLTATPGLRGCTIRPGPSPARSPKLRGGRMAGASSSTCGRRPNRPLPRRHWIAAVYAIEDKARFAPAAERVEHRKATASRLEAFFVWADATVGKLSGKLKLAKAFRYTITRREALTRFVTDGRLEADNNVAENAMRGIALGRRNYLFAGSNSGGERAAAIYTLVATAKLNGLNPETYLKDVLAKIAEGHTIKRIDELVPWRIIPAAVTSSP